jgi:hypothetical protein
LPLLLTTIYIQLTLLVYDLDPPGNYRAGSRGVIRDFQGWLQRDLPERLRRILENEVQKYAGFPETGFTDQLAALVNEAITSAFRSYSESTSSSIEQYSDTTSQAFNSPAATSIEPQTEISGTMLDEAGFFDGNHFDICFQPEYSTENQSVLETSFWSQEEGTEALYWFDDTMLEHAE